MEIVFTVHGLVFGRDVLIGYQSVIYGLSLTDIDFLNEFNTSKVNIDDKETIGVKISKTYLTIIQCLL